MLLKVSLLLAVVAVALQLGGVFDTQSAFQVVIQPDAHWCVQKNGGSFAQIGAALAEVKSRLVALSGRRYSRAVGIYLDSPADVAAADLRWYVGFDCSELSAVELDALAKREAREQRPVQLLTVSRLPTLETTFPHRHALSPMLGASRVWPAVNRYVQEHAVQVHGPAIEFYDADDAGNVQTIRYLMPLDESIEKQLLVQ